MCISSLLTWLSGDAFKQDGSISGLNEYEKVDVMILLISCFGLRILWFKSFLRKLEYCALQILAPSYLLAHFSKCLPEDRPGWCVLLSIWLSCRWNRSTPCLGGEQFAGQCVAGVVTILSYIHIVYRMACVSCMLVMLDVFNPDFPFEIFFNLTCLMVHNAE